MKELLVSAGVLALLGAAVGGGLKLMGNELPVVGSSLRQALLGVLGAGFLVLGLTHDDGSKPGGNGSALPPTVSSTATSSASPSVTGAATTSSLVTIPPPTTIDPRVCVISTTNPLAALRETPDVFGQEIMKIPAAQYTVTNTTMVTRVRQPHRWLMVQVAGRSGWIEDNTFNVETKSPGCR